MNQNGQTGLVAVVKATGLRWSTGLKLNKSCMMENRENAGLRVGPQLRESHPADGSNPLAGCPVGYGGGNPATSQTNVLNSVQIQTEGRSPITRFTQSIIQISRLQTPAGNIRRSNSIGACDFVKKRKVVDTSFNSSQIETVNKVECMTAVSICETIKSLINNSKDMEKYITENSNTKREIKETSANIRRNIEVLKSSVIKNWLEEHRWVSPKIPTYDVDVQTDPKFGKEDVACQTDLTDLSQAKKYIDIQYYDTFEKFNDTIDQDWDEETFTRTEIITGNPVHDKEAAVKTVLVEENDTGMENSIQRQFRDRYPDLRDIEGDMGVLEQVLRRTQAETPRRLKIIKLKMGKDLGEFWSKLQLLKNETMGEEHISIHQTRSIPLNTLRKMTECVFS